MTENFVLDKELNARLDKMFMVLRWEQKTLQVALILSRITPQSELLLGNANKSEQCAQPIIEVDIFEQLALCVLLHTLIDV